MRSSLHQYSVLGFYDIIWFDLVQAYNYRVVSVCSTSVALFMYLSFKIDKMRSSFYQYIIFKYYDIIFIDLT